MDPTAKKKSHLPLSIVIGIIVLVIAGSAAFFLTPVRCSFLADASLGIGISSRNQCITDVASFTHNEKTCLSIQDATYRRDLVEYCVRKVARYTNDPKKCAILNKEFDQFYHLTEQCTDEMKGP